MNKYHISLELPKILLTLSEMTSCEEARLAALSLQPSGDFFEVQKRLSETEADAELPLIAGLVVRPRSEAL